MLVRLATILLLASALAAQAQLPVPNSTPASQMAARANANASQARDAAAGAVTGLSPDDTPSQSSDSQRIIRGQVNGTSSDPLLHYPYGRYGATLGNVDPSSLANPFTRNAPAAMVTSTPQSPFATPGGTQRPHRGR